MASRSPRRLLSPAQRKRKSQRAAAKRKARLAKVPREPISKVVLYDRQGGLCTYCDEPLLDKVSSNHHDHVFPLACGGRDLMSNSALLHPECNRAKGRRVWAIGVTPHRGVPSARGSARTAAISHYRLTAAADNVLPSVEHTDQTEEVTSE